jgi:hypothetical protein
MVDKLTTTRRDCDSDGDDDNKLQGPLETPTSTDDGVPESHPKRSAVIGQTFDGVRVDGSTRTQTQVATKRPQEAPEQFGRDRPNIPASTERIRSPRSSTQVTTLILPAQGPLPSRRQREASQTSIRHPNRPTIRMLL